MEKVFEGWEENDFYNTLHAKAGGRSNETRIVKVNGLDSFNIFSVYDLKTAMILMDSRSLR